VLKAAGHFPFWDSPDAFAAALAKAFPSVKSRFDVA